MIAVYYKWKAPDGRIFVSLNQDEWLAVAIDPGESDYCEVARLFAEVHPPFPVTFATRWFWLNYDGFSWDDIETVRCEVTRGELHNAGVSQ